MIRTAIAALTLIILAGIGGSALAGAAAAIRLTASDSCASLNWASDIARHSALTAACRR